MPDASSFLGFVTGSTETGSGPDVRSVHAAWIVFWAVASLLIVFFLVTLGVMLARFVRRGGGEQEPSGEQPGEARDPWTEAGRRAKAYPRPEDEQ